MIDIELEEEMKMPFKCDCGKLFDLNDGYASLKPMRDRNIVCKDCHCEEQELKDKINSLEVAIENLEMEGNNKRKIKKLRNKLDNLLINH